MAGARTSAMLMLPDPKRERLSTHPVAVPGTGVVAVNRLRMSWVYSEDDHPPLEQERLPYNMPIKMLQNYSPVTQWMCRGSISSSLPSFIASARAFSSVKP